MSLSDASRNSPIRDGEKKTRRGRQETEQMTLDEREEVGRRRGPGRGVCVRSVGLVGEYAIAHVFSCVLL